MSQTTPLSLPFLSFILSALFVPSICDSTFTQQYDSKIRGMFVFGSSVVDNGNNNFLTNSLVRVDYPPYGIDFPLGPTGRFCNGKTFIDALGEKLEIPEYIPSFYDPSTNERRILHGVNYASGGSGILDNTGAVTGNVTSLNKQISNFERVTLPDLESQLGSNSRDALSKYLFVVASGGNDYVLNYFLSNRSVTVKAFTANLTTNLSNQLKILYSSGARKFVLLTINPNGCSPAATSRFPTQNGCVQSFNDALLLFNDNLKNLVDTIRPQMPGSNLVLVNTYKIIRDIIRFPILRGFRDVTNACCEVATGALTALCRRGGATCTDRNEYVYFDGLHTTQAVNVVIASKAFGSVLRTESYPFNIKRLAEIKHKLQSTTI